MTDLQFIGNVAQLLGSLTLIYSFLPQIYKLIKLKNADGINLQYWTILTVGVACIAVNLTISNVNIFIQFTQWFNVVLAFIVLFLSNKYQKEAKLKKNLEVKKEAEEKLKLQL